jgi:hypothetical protein
MYCRHAQQANRRLLGRQWHANRWRTLQAAEHTQQIEELWTRNANELWRNTVMQLGRLTLTATALAVSLVAGSAQAIPLATLAAGMKAAAEGSSLIERVDGCNRVCQNGRVQEWGGIVRWHRHVGNACRPITCTPRIRLGDI